MKTLVAYSSRHGSTAEIAAYVAEVLQARQFEVDLKCMADVESLDEYELIVLGSAVYAGSWLKQAAEFLIEHEDILCQRPTYLFSSGPTGRGNARRILESWMFPNDLKPLMRHICPKDVAIFHGKIDPDELSFAEKTIVRVARAKIGDYRNWETIRNWAKSIMPVAVLV